VAPNRTVPSADELGASAQGADHFDRLDFLLLPAFFKAMATACFCGLPAFISVLMFELIVLCDEPFFRGKITNPFFSGKYA
jgi:hypothetical protein